MDYTVRVTGTSQSITDYNRQQLALGENSYTKRTLVNNQGAELTLVKGLLLGVHNTGANAGKLVPFDSADVSGGAIPRFVCNDHRVLADAAEKTISVIDFGEVDQSMLAFINPANALDTNIDTVGTPRDLLVANSRGINPVSVDDATGNDN